MSTDEPHVGSDALLIDADEGGVAQFIARARRRGPVTMDEVEAALPQDQMSNAQIEQVMAAISAKGIRIVEIHEGGEEEEGRAADRDDLSVELDTDGEATLERRLPTNRAAEILGHTDDPIRMYLREMDGGEMLSCVSEAVVTKRTEAGRDMMIWGLCESFLTMHAIIKWSEAIDSGEMQPRETIYLDAMHSTEPAAEMLLPEVDREISQATAGLSYKEDDEDQRTATASGLNRRPVRI
ncbi:hypothetical protein HNO88_004216 [Novosphingobium chloroacetimidivorans]|uniref:RNA polymerase sigma factor 70 region 1.1 domain-containing protein n=1 Tax=Novosphingobium chloroacetimidivorans TaxID=1428314 RepID=A0A7W7NZ41_9SPHN|nr:RNA polymerase sigma factor region1.1 domain-containing protein [Novosphingobium chloroacetimidivorans]MBB4860870.1 hypothetical protein [Novosphingobium chloroacetimidivorans]